MILYFVNSFESERLKTRRSAAAWLVLVGGFFIPAIVLIARLDNFSSLPAENAADHIWEKLYNHSWQFMAFALLPMGVILATSLITQLEFKNNTWKQLHTTPQSFTTIFFAKLAVILLMMLQFFILFNIGIYLSGVIPAVFKGVPYPTEPIPFKKILYSNTNFFIDCLPIVALQYLVSLQFKNFLAPVGVGLALYVASIFAINWAYGYTFPYTYCALHFMGKTAVTKSVNIHHLAAGYFIVITAVSYMLYMGKKEKG